MYREAYHWSNIEQLHALTRNTCLFVGLSMEDPNLRRLLDISITQSSNNQNHYAILCHDKKKAQGKGEMMKEKILNDLGINVIWVDDFGEIPKLIDEIFK